MKFSLQLLTTSWMSWWLWDIAIYLSTCVISKSSLMGHFEMHDVTRISSRVRLRIMSEGLIELHKMFSSTAITRWNIWTCRISWRDRRNGYSYNNYKITSIDELMYQNIAMRAQSTMTFGIGISIRTISHRWARHVHDNDNKMKTGLF